jgi:hypothetical protein
LSEHPLDRQAERTSQTNGAHCLGAGNVGPGGVWVLVAPPVFKTDERRIASLAGSIPVRLRMDSAAGNGILAAVRISAEQSVDVRPNVSHLDY